MISNNCHKFAWLVLFILEPVFVFASDQPTPSDAPPDFSPPAGPPPPPPLPIDDYVMPMVLIALIFGLFYFIKLAKTQRS
jgi:hypothetical protein